MSLKVGCLSYAGGGHDPWWGQPSHPWSMVGAAITPTIHGGGQPSHPRSMVGAAITPTIHGGGSHHTHDPWWGQPSHPWSMVGEENPTRPWYISIIHFENTNYRPHRVGIGCLPQGKKPSFGDTLQELTWPLEDQSPLGCCSSVGFWRAGCPSWH